MLSHVLVPTVPYGPLCRALTCTRTYSPLQSTLLCSHMYSYIQSLAVHSAIPCCPLCRALLCTQIAQTAEYLRNPPVAWLVFTYTTWYYGTVKIIICYSISYLASCIGMVSSILGVNGSSVPHPRIPPLGTSTMVRTSAPPGLMSVSSWTWSMSYRGQYWHGGRQCILYRALWTACMALHLCTQVCVSYTKAESSTAKKKDLNGGSK